ncbi:MAG: glucose-6-phosphate isomerase [Proteobacteria bacterium]|nr:glucose-6-phosphate isomerase [Pseudomonadota bacterium]MBU1612637.1 glucose-6-phosphate isomerase [Pseudomonadota bacterium]
MAAGTLDWTNATLDSLTTAPYRAQANELAGRMASEVAAGKLPFLSMGYMDSLLDELEQIRPSLAKFDHLLLLGIGGSALGARALQQAFAPGQDLPGHQGPWLWISDNVGASTLEAYMAKLPPEKTLVVTVSKSGGTIETVGQYFIIKKWLMEKLGDAWKDNILLVTDANNGFLREEVNRYQTMSLTVPDNLGGRYSVLSAVGLLPAAFLGMNVASMVAGAREVAKGLSAPGLDGCKLAAHPAFELAVWGRALMDANFDEMIFFSYVPAMASFGDWFAQLWAESLGKQGRGSQPIPAVGVTDQHSVNQMFLDGKRNKSCLLLSCPSLPAGPRFPHDIPDKFDYVRGKEYGELLQAEGLGTQMALCKCGVPLVEVRLSEDSPHAVGAMIVLFGAATILTGWLMGINPLDQPAVELGKRLAKARLGAEGLEEEKADLAAFLNVTRIEQEF